MFFICLFDQRCNRKEEDLNLIDSMNVLKYSLLLLYTMQHLYLRKIKSQVCRSLILDVNDIQILTNKSFWYSAVAIFQS